MKANTPSGRVTSFGVIKGAMVQETYAAFRTWDFGQPKKANIERIRQQNLIGAANANWLRNVLWNLSSRFDPMGVDRPLVVLAQRGLSLDLWRPLLLWHISQSEFLVKDFLLNWLFPHIAEGHLRFKPSEVETHLAYLLKPNKLVKEPWSATTINRVSGGLLRMAASFGLLEGGTVKTAVPFHLPDPCFLYVLRALLDRDPNPARALDAPDWQVFLISRQAVHQELLRLHQYRKVDYHAAGSLFELRLPVPDLLSYANGWPL
jgi:hypothetical protein